MDEVKRSYSIVLKSSARKELLNLPYKTINTIEAQIDTLAFNPRPHGCKKLTGSINEYRIRIGKYRVIYTVSDDAFIIHIIKVAHRKDAY